MKRNPGIAFGILILTLFGPFAYAGGPPVSAEALNSYLQDQGSPLAGEGRVFIQEGKEWNVDPRLIVGIAGAESSFGTHICADFNAWNWFWNIGLPCIESPFVSWEEGIKTVTQKIRTSYFDDRGLSTIPAIGGTYCAEACDFWVPNVTQFYTDLGGDLNDLTYPRSTNTGSIRIERDREQYLTIADSDQHGLDVQFDFAIEAWVKPESEIPPGEEYVIASKWSFFVSEKAYLFLYYHNGVSPGLAVSLAADSTSDGKDAHVPYTLPVGEWHHVAMVFKSQEGRVSFFVDGEFIGSADGFERTINNGRSPFQIGTRQGLALTAFDGLIDDVQVWNIARTPMEILRDYQTELSGDESGLVGYWQLNGNFIDAGSNHNDLIPMGGPVFSDDVPF